MRVEALAAAAYHLLAVGDEVDAAERVELAPRPRLRRVGGGRLRSGGRRSAARAQILRLSDGSASH